LVLALRAIIPLAAFVTFVIYFIRWSSEWARQHADEEFRNRTRVPDIGRSAWLLEAVRDAQENQKEIPVDLLKDLLRNLFAYTAPADVADLHPQAVTDLIMQGLASLRVKTPDGTEVEARGK
jgi:aryl carrier-like protein